MSSIQPPVVFALNASRALGSAIAQSLGVALAEHEEREFEDAEHKARPLVAVRGRDVHVVQSLYGDASQSINDKPIRLLLFLGALKDAAARRVRAIVPYLAYARKDRKTKPRDPVTTRYVAGLFEAVGTDCVVTADVHNLAALQNAFRCRPEHLEAALCCELVRFIDLSERVVVASPDVGGIKRAEAFRERLAQALSQPTGRAFAEKYRRTVACGHAPPDPACGLDHAVEQQLSRPR